MFTELSPQEWGATVDYDTWSDRHVEKDKVVIHYNGPAVHNYDTGRAREMQYLQAVERHHLGKGWRGFAYGWAIGMSGTVYRARGWNLYGAHRGDVDEDGISENNEAIPILLILGGDQEPNGDMLSSLVELIESLAQDSRSDGLLEVYGHRDVGSTECPGDVVYDLLLDWPPSPISTGTSVMSQPRASQRQAEAWAQTNAVRKDSPYTALTIKKIVDNYWQWGIHYGVDPALALAQSAKETGFWSYGEDVGPDQFNFAGIGATGGVPGKSFPTISAGVRAHVLRMRMYAVNDGSVYDVGILGRALPEYHWGRYPNIENFNGVWAVPGTNYGQSIVNDYLVHMQATEEPALTLEERVRFLELRVTSLEQQR